jgi:quercetin dioxygenase-like cupin family protein
MKPTILHKGKSVRKSETQSHGPTVRTMSSPRQPGCSLELGFLLCKKKGEIQWHVHLRFITAGTVDETKKEVY